MKTLKKYLFSPVMPPVKYHNRDSQWTGQYAQFVELLPAVLKNLKQAGKLYAYTNFMEMTAYDRFPMDNIAHLLFLTIPSRPHTRNLKTVGHSSDEISGS